VRAAGGAAGARRPRRARHRHLRVRLPGVPARRLRPGAGAPRRPGGRAPDRAPPRAQRGAGGRRGVGLADGRGRPLPGRGRGRGRLVRQRARPGPVGRRAQARQPHGHRPERRRGAVRGRRPLGQVVHPAVRHQPGPGRRIRAGPGARRPAGPVRPGHRGVPPEPVLRVVGGGPHRHRGGRRRGFGRYRPGPLPGRRSRGPRRRAALAPRARRPDPAERPGGAVAGPPIAGCPGLGGGAGPRPDGGRRGPRPPGHRVRGQDLPGRARRAGGERRHPRGPGPPHPQAGDDLPGGARVGARPGRVGRRDRGGGGEAAVRRAAGAGHPAGGRGPDAGAGQARRRRRCAGPGGGGAGGRPARPRAGPSPARTGRGPARARPAAVAGAAGPPACVLQRLPAQPLDRGAGGLGDPGAGWAATG
jgi:hypothetical protein